MVFGFPLSGSLSSGGNFTSGLVSALRGLRDAAGEVQITAPVQPGNSGGPLMDASGLVIGVVQAKLDALRTARITGDIAQNVNFAISLEVLADFLAKNRVAFQDSSSSAPLDTARVAELAQSFTYYIECRGRSQQATASSSTKAEPPIAATRPPIASSQASVIGSASQFSINCALARTPTEIAICTNPQLKALDGKHSQAYSSVKERLSPTGFSFVQRNQIQWIQERERKCGDSVDCLTQEISKRISELNRL